MTSENGNSTAAGGRTPSPRSLLTTRALLNYSTPAKLANLLLCEAEKKLGVIRPRSAPYRAIIDVANACGLRCPYCPTGAREYGRRPGFLGVDRVRELMDRVGKDLYLAFLYNWGEPLLNPHLAEIVALVHSRGVMTVISTHLNSRETASMEAVFDAGLDHLIVSIDGATQDVYSRYRVGGDLGLALDNLRHLVEYKGKNGLRNPSIEWQFLIFDHNRHEQEAAREMAGRIGVDMFTTPPGFVPERPLDFWEGEKRCNFLWDTVTMQADGGIGACCHHIDKEDDFVDSPAATFRHIWHAPRFITARRLFSPRAGGRLPAGLRHPCLVCPLVGRQPHLSRLFQGEGGGAVRLAGQTNSVRTARDRPGADRGTVEGDRP